MRISASLLCLFLVGCASYIDRAEVAQQSIQVGDFETLASVALSEADQSSADTLLWQLEAGAALRAQGKINESITYFERVEQALRVEEERPDFSVAEEITGAFSNDYTRVYRAKPADRIFASTYQLLNWMELGDLGRARIAVTRLRFVQERWGNKEIYRQLSLADEKTAEVEKLKPSESSQAVWEEMEQDLLSYGATATFDDAFSHWLQGVFLMHTAQEASDFERARKELLAARQLNPECLVIQEAQVDWEKLSQGVALDRRVYVIVEKGHSPEWYEQRIDFPAFLVSNRVQFVSVALPAIRRANPEYSLALNLDDKNFNLSPISRPETLVAQHFAATFSEIKTRAVVSALTKAASVYAINQATERREQQRQDNESRWLRVFGQVGTGVYSLASSRADLRHWRSLTARFSIARLTALPGSKIGVVGKPEVACILPEGKVLLVSVKSTSENSPIILRCSVLQP